MSCRSARFPRAAALVLILAAGLALPAGAAIYRWVDADGRIHYTDILVGSERMDGYDEGSLAAMLASAGW